MREIKFRAWDDDAHGMIMSDSYAQDGFSVGETLSSFFDDCFGLEHQQYTGLKDRNGVEIYEGDVVQAEYAKGRTGVAPVEYDVLGFGAWNSTDDYNLLNYEPRLEVIGNIYENPELIEPKVD